MSCGTALRACCTIKWTRFGHKREGNKSRQTQSSWLVGALFRSSYFCCPTICARLYCTAGTCDVIELFQYLLPVVAHPHPGQDLVLALQLGEDHRTHNAVQSKYCPVQSGLSLYHLYPTTRAVRPTWEKRWAQKSFTQDFTLAKVQPLSCSL